MTVLRVDVRGSGGHFLIYKGKRRLCNRCWYLRNGYALSNVLRYVQSCIGL